MVLVKYCGAFMSVSYVFNNERRIYRPNMSSVVVMLGSESVLPQPKTPGYFMETDPPQGCHDSSPSNEFTMSVLEAR